MPHTEESEETGCHCRDLYANRVIDRESLTNEANSTDDCQWPCLPTSPSLGEKEQLLGEGVCCSTVSFSEITAT